jgi:hypothetical protein
MLTDGMIREKPDSLLKYQRKIIEYLDSLRGYNIIVKPFQHSSYEDCGMLSLFNKYKNIKVIDFLTFEEIISRYRVKIIVFELMATAFYESLGHDAELFALYDSVRPIEESALAKLKERVHYFEDVDDMIREIDHYLKGEVEIKRDNIFYNRYVHKKDAKQNILQLIDNLIEGKDSYGPKSSPNLSQSRPIKVNDEVK